MGQPRYVNASEKTVYLAEGVYLRAKMQNCPSSGYVEHGKAWDAWASRHPDLVEAATKQQCLLFDIALSL